MTIKVLGICGSPKLEKSSSEFLLGKALEAAEGTGSVKSELLRLADHEILPCTGCDNCVRHKPCPEDAKDDVPKVLEKMENADAIIFASPSYFGTVPGLLKNLIDRSRTYKMEDHRLRDKIVGVIVAAGLRHGGQETTAMTIVNYALAQGMIVAGGVGNPVTEAWAGMTGLQSEGFTWRGTPKDEVAIRNSQLVGERVTQLALRFLKG
ncbi:MAG: flavodoxin family protein [Candidatus Hermodarchaeota archaeon]